MARIVITLNSDLCAASGSGFGNMIDTDIVMDHLGIPYIPGRRIKGCLRQSAEDLRDYGCEQASQEAIERLFGNAEGNAGALTVGSAYLPKIEEIRKAILDAENTKVLKDVASPAKVPDLFTYVRGSTALENGKAKDGTLRFMRVVSHYSPMNPMEEMSFECEIQLDDPKLEELLKLCCRATRHIGSSRNRGLGDVSFTYLPSAVRTVEKGKKTENISTEKQVVRYKLHLDAPLMIPGVENRIASISARAVIGCLSACWLRNHSADEPEFRRLFLSGETQWQELTPVSHGKQSIPAPRFLARLKGTEPRLVNLLSELDENERKTKKKTLDGSFACMDEQGFELLSVNVSSTYHHSTDKKNKKGTLYVEESLDSGIVYGGMVIVPADLAEDVTELIRSADFRFGRSRSAQYGACRLTGAPNTSPLICEALTPIAGETVYALLISDLDLFENGLNTCSADAVRKAISAAAGLPDEMPVSPDPSHPVTDNCAYRDLGGYQQMWQMRKAITTVVCAGSYYRFVSDGKTIPREIRLGEYPQEGLGRIRLISDSEMKKMSNLSVTSPDRFSEAEQGSAELRSVLLTRAAEEAQKARALRYVMKKRKLRSEVQIGRLRLMLAEASDLTDLVTRIGSIKTESYRKNSLKMLNELYSGSIPGNLDPEKLQVPPQNPDPATMLADESELTALIMQDTEACRRVTTDWKRLLSAVLSLAYYQERKEEPENA